MNDDYILLRCQICNCEFAVKERFIKYNDDWGRYISCPAYGKHKDIHVIGRKELKRLMEEKRAVNL